MVEEIQYCCQLIVACVVILVSLINIAFTDENICLWTTLASGTLDYLLPNLSLKRNEPFYPTLLSNASMDCYPNNTVAKYTTKLPNMMELEGDWEVGLVKISCPGALINVHGDEYVFRVINHAKNYAKVYTLKEGYYRDVYDFVDAVNDLLRVPRERNDILKKTIGIERQKVCLRFFELERVVELTIKPGYKVYFNEALARKLDFRIMPYIPIRQWAWLRNQTVQL